MCRKQINEYTKSHLNDQIFEAFKFLQRYEVDAQNSTVDITSHMYKPPYQEIIINVDRQCMQSAINLNEPLHKKLELCKITANFIDGKDLRGIIQRSLQPILDEYFVEDSNYSLEFLSDPDNYDRNTP